MKKQFLDVFSEDLKLNSVPLEEVIFRKDLLVIKVDDEVGNRWQISCRPFMFKMSSEDFIDYSDLLDNEYIVGKYNHRIKGHEVVRYVCEVKNSQLVQEKIFEIEKISKRKYDIELMHVRMILYENSFELVCEKGKLDILKIDRT